jgi:hypothetical protein
MNLPIMHRKYIDVSKLAAILEEKVTIQPLHPDLNHYRKQTVAVAPIMSTSVASAGL